MELVVPGIELLVVSLERLMRNSSSRPSKLRGGIILDPPLGLFLALYD